MAVQKSKGTAMRRGNRRSHDALAPASFQECPDTGELKRPHHVTQTAEGLWYKGRLIKKPVQAQPEQAEAAQ